MHEHGLIVHYAEIATKGKNRSRFVQQLADNLDRRLCSLGAGRTQTLSGRLWVPLPKETKETKAEEALHRRLQTVYGVCTYSFAIACPLNMQSMQEVALGLAKQSTFETFRITSRRVFKNQPYSSMQVDMDLGAHVLENCSNTKVKLRNPDLEIFVEMMPNRAFVYAEKHPGLSGLPVGVTGRVACLLSGGIDSPVAAARMQQRGCRVVFVHFHSQPFLNRVSQEKAEALANHLAEYQGSAMLYLVPLGELQRDIVTCVPAPMRMILYRRFMLRLAENIAVQEHAKVLVTGESLGQVASQTLSNLVAIDACVSLPIMRPLIGFDKAEIVAAAKKLGTYETSIQPDQDCCQFFVPKNPETHARKNDVEMFEARLAIDALCNDALSRTEKKSLTATFISESIKNNACSNKNAYHATEAIL